MAQEQRSLNILNALTNMTLDDFDNRLRLQKLTFILKRMGLNLGYSFNWYHRGPYSPSLTQQLFSTRDDDRLVIDAPVLSEGDSRYVRMVQEFLGDEIDNASRLELIASTWFFIRHSGYSSDEREKIIDEVYSRKSSLFTRAEIESAFDRIISFYTD